MRLSPSLLATTFAALLAVGVAAQGQTSPPGLVLNLLSQVAGNVTSTDQTNLQPAPANLKCSFAQSAHSGNVNVAWSIQARDEGITTTAVYNTILTSWQFTPTDNTSYPLYVGPGITPTSLIGANIPVPTVWRVIATIGGNTTPLSNATVHCRVQ